MTLKEQIQWCKAQVAKYKALPTGEGWEGLIAVTSILTKLKALENKEPPHPFHQQAIGYWQLFLRHNRLSEQITPKDGKAMREILYALEKVEKITTPEQSYKAFRAILDNWHRTGKFYENKKNLTTISNNLNEIIGLIKNGATKRDSSLNEAQRLHNELTQN